MRRTSRAGTNHIDWSDDLPGVHGAEDIATARRNVERYDWAAELRDRSVARADAYVEKHGGLEGLWSLVTGQAVPRSSSVGPGSPLLGSFLAEEYGSRGWIGPNYDQPPTNDAFPRWKLVDPASGYVFPTNDFAAYRESGRDERGVFDSDRADDALLTNDLYPEMGASWGVDDGTGWTDDAGNTYTFVAFYNHWHVWYEVMFAVRSLRNAFVLGGNQRHARAATVLLDRIADVYPGMSISGYPPDGPFANSHGGSGQGNVVGCIWEHNLLKAFISAYHAVSPAIGGDDELLGFLEEKADRYDLERKSSADAIRSHFEENVVRGVLPDVKAAQVRGNFGMHQSAIATSAVVADDPDGYTIEALDFVFREGEYVREDDGTPWGSQQITGGELLPRLVDTVDRDGQSNESPNYNAFHVGTLQGIADVLSSYDAYDGPDLGGNVKFRRLGTTFLPFTLLNRFSPHIGDGDKVGNPGFDISPKVAVRAFERTGDPTFAQWAVVLNGGSTDGLTGSVFSADADRLRREIERIDDEDGPLDLPSTNLAGFGLAVLRDGTAPAPDETTDRRVAWLCYGRTGSDVGGSSHNHRDALNLGVCGYGLNLAPDLGYPESTGDWPKRWSFTGNTVSHNTVVVDDAGQDHQWVGDPRHFDDAGRVQLVDVDAPDAYRQCDAYRRTTVMVRVDESASYLVDAFRVSGGDEHVYSFHGGPGELSTTRLDPDPQDDGTYAGQDVPLPERGERIEYTDDVGNGYEYFDGVRRDVDPPDQFEADWDVDDIWGVLDGDDETEDDVATGGPDPHLHLTMVGEVDEVTLADGEPPQKPGNPDRLPYVLARRSGTDIDSTFSSVIEPYDGERVVDSVAAAPVAVDGDDGAASAVRVELDDGRVDYVVTSADPTATVVVDDRFRFSGFAAVYSERDGEPASAYVHDGSIEVLADGADVSLVGDRIDGTIADFTRELIDENEVVARFEDADGIDLDALDGAWLYTETDNARNGAYEICGTRRIGDGLVSFDVGDRTTVRGFVDPENPDEGYEYAIAEGAPVSIPTSATWER